MSREAFKQAHNYSSLANGGKDSIESTLAIEGGFESSYRLGDYESASKWGEMILFCLKFAEDGHMPSLNLDVPNTVLTVYANPKFEVCIKMSKIKAEQKDWKAAIEYAEQAREAEPPLMSEAWVQMAAVYTLAGDSSAVEKTIETLKKHIASLLKQKQSESKSLLLSPLDREDVTILKCYLDLADMYAAKHDNAMAMRYYEQVTKLAGDAIAFQNNRTVIEAKRKLDALVKENDRHSNR